MENINNLDKYRTIDSNFSSAPEKMSIVGEQKENFM